jgi:hypothetical protein
LESLASLVEQHACDALSRGFDSCQQGPRGVAVYFGPEPSGCLINQLDKPNFVHNIFRFVPRSFIFRASDARSPLNSALDLKFLHIASGLLCILHNLH